MITPVARSGCRHIYNQYTIRVARRDELREFLGERKIGTEIYYPVPLHLQVCFEELGYQAGDCPISEKSAEEAVSVPIYTELTETQQQTVVNAVTEFLNG